MTLHAERPRRNDGGELRAQRLNAWLILFPLLAPAVLLAAGNDAFGFDPPGYLDSFVYVGYFWHYPEHLWVFDDNSNYKISRLPWILAGLSSCMLWRDRSSPPTCSRISLSRSAPWRCISS